MRTPATTDGCKAHNNDSVEAVFSMRMMVIVGSRCPFR